MEWCYIITNKKFYKITQKKHHFQQLKWIGAETRRDGMTIKVQTFHVNLKGLQLPSILKSTIKVSGLEMFNFLKNFFKKKVL